MRPTAAATRHERFRHHRKRKRGGCFAAGLKRQVIPIPVAVTLLFRPACHPERKGGLKAFRDRFASGKAADADYTLCIAKGDANPAGKIHSGLLEKSIRATPHNTARANPEKIWVLMKAFFCRNTLCISRKSDKIRARIFQEAPMADCAVLPSCRCCTEGHPRVFRKKRRNTRS